MPQTPSKNQQETPQTKPEGMIGRSALLIGATGQVGQHVLKELLASSHFSKVGEYGRRVTPLDSIVAGKDKLEQKTVDFEKIDEAGLKDGKWDVVIVTLGTTRKLAGSAEAFEKIDRDYVINAARAAKVDTPQRLVYVSSGGANASSPFLYPKSKGLTEIGLAKLGYSDTIIFRPAFLAGATRPEGRPAESILGVFTDFASRFSDKLQIHISELGKSIVKAGVLGSSGLPASAQATKVEKDGYSFTLIDNPGALGLSKEA